MEELTREERIKVIKWLRNEVMHYERMVEGLKKLGMPDIAIKAKEIVIESYKNTANNMETTAFNLYKDDTKTNQD